MHSPLPPQISTTAKQSFVANMIPFILVVLFITSSPTAEASSMRLSFGNVMQEIVNIHCHSNRADLGPHTIRTSIGWYAFTVSNSETTGDRYWCQFESPGKLSTVLEVFVARSAADNVPCHCSGECTWIIEDRGISCNLAKYFHPWGGALH